MIRFRYSWRSRGQVFSGEFSGENEAVLRAHIQKLGGELLEILSAEPVQEAPVKSVPDPDAPTPSDYIDRETRRIERAIEEDLVPPLSEPGRLSASSAILEEAAGGNPAPAQWFRAKFFVGLVIGIGFLIYFLWTSWTGSQSNPAV